MVRSSSGPEFAGSRSVSATLYGKHAGEPLTTLIDDVNFREAAKRSAAQPSGACRNAPRRRPGHDFASTSFDAEEFSRIDQSMAAFAEDSSGNRAERRHLQWSE